MANIKVSDYISRFLVENGIRDLFLISGGGMMHMLDSVGRQDGLNLIFNLNEQASSICAESYAQYTNRLGACMVTTGPGATNAVTGCAAAWGDSTPVLFISGQAKTADMGQLRGLRFFGAQEIAIIPMVTPITKYAAIVLRKDDIRYHLEKAVYLARQGRRGPVWLDVPLDIQGSQVDQAALRGFEPEAEGFGPPAGIGAEIIGRIYDMLAVAERPVVLIGHGVVAADAGRLARQLAAGWNIPFLATWRAKGVFSDDDPLFMGYPGIPAPRYANYALQNADLALIVGTRLNPAITAYQEDNFAPSARKIVVDIEPAEMDKLSMDIDIKIEADAGVFLSALWESRELWRPANRARWLDFCTEVKQKYNILNETQPMDNEGLVDGYFFADRLSDYCNAEDIFVGSSSGRTCGISHLAYRCAERQRFISSMGLGSMGWCLPSAIACCLAGGRRTVTLEGDGSLQHNIQELALIKTYKLPIKLFIWANSGYASIHAMQRNNFSSRFFGCGAGSGLQFPRLEAVARAYGLPYRRIESNAQVEGALAEIMADDTPMLCEIRGSIAFDEIPKSMTVAGPDGSFKSSRLENLYPYLPEPEQRGNMPDWSRP